MQTAKWGHPTWYWFHRLPLCAESKLENSDQLLWIEFTTLCKDILPCKYCRESYAGFIEEDSLKAHFSDPQFQGDYRLAFAHWLFVLHNKVNRKLERTIETDFYNLCCLNMGDDVAQWEDSFWDFTGAVLWNFENEEWRIVAYLRFFQLLPIVLAPTPLGKRIRAWLADNTLTRDNLIDVDSAKKWGWSFWSSASDSSHSKQFSQFSDMDEKYESWRSNTCSLAPPTDASKPKSC